MILIASREEKELIQRLRTIGAGESVSVSGLSAEVLTLKQQIAQLQIDKSKIEEQHAKEERELRHMIGLEKKRQEVEIAQAKKETELTVREGNLAAEKGPVLGAVEVQHRAFRDDGEVPEGHAHGHLGAAAEREHGNHEAEPLMANDFDNYWSSRIAALGQSQSNYSQYLGQLAIQQSQAAAQINAYSQNPFIASAPKAEDEFGWLRRRVSEVCWKAA